MSIIEKLRNFKAGWIDVGFIKLAVFAAALLFAKLWESILNLDWYWYLIISVAALIRPVITSYKWIRLAASK
ncbi:MAG: hypothetical protein Q7T72_09130 [Bacteroidales bacterium]|nr:hypothetical protein [Bacteroidales bacterium]